MLLLHFTLPPIRGGLLYCSGSSKPEPDEEDSLSPGKLLKTRLSQHTGQLAKDKHTHTQQQQNGR